MTPTEEKRAREARLTAHSKLASAHRVTWVIIAIAGTLLTVAVVSLALTDLNQKTALRNANIALEKATAATHNVTTALAQVAANSRRISKTQAVQHSQIVTSCRRLNVLRAVSNSSNYGDFLLLESIVHFPSTRPGARVRLQKALLAKTWTPLTNCAALDGGAFQPVQPIFFLRRIPPPLALSFRNASRVSPIGSVSWSP